MPVIKSATKRLRQIKRRSAHNRLIRDGLKETVAKFRKKPTEKQLAHVMSSLDKAAKTNLIHKNKASRLKSRLSKLLTK